MPVRLATHEDINRCVDLGLEVLSKSAYAAKPNTLKGRRTFARALSDKSMILLVAEHEGRVVGFLLGMAIDQWFSDSKFATDLAFYVQHQHTNYAPMMIRKFRNWAKKQPKVTDISLAISSGADGHERTGRMYEKVGFERVGGLYTIQLETEQ